MANLNKVMLIGRLTRDPEIRVFSNGGKVAHFGFAVNNRRKNSSTGQWEDAPVFLDVDVFNRGDTGKQADLIEQSVKKGHQLFIEGHLRMDEWTSQDGQKRSKIKIDVDNFQFLERREGGMGDSGSSGGSRFSRPVAAPAMARPSGGDQYDGGPEPPPPPSAPGMDDNIPF